MSKPKVWTHAEILDIAAQREFAVHKYSWAQQNVRKMTRRLCKDGKLAMVASDGTHFYYRTPKELV